MRRVCIYEDISMILEQLWPLLFLKSCWFSRTFLFSTSSIHDQLYPGINKLLCLHQLWYVITSWILSSDKLIWEGLISISNKFQFYYERLSLTRVSSKSIRLSLTDDKLFLIQTVKYIRVVQEITVCKCVHYLK
jgi:hypothetical protein